MYKLAEETIGAVLKGKSGTKAVKELRLFAEANAWPSAHNKKVIHKTIKMLIKNRIPQDDHDALLDTLLGIEKTLPRITERKITLLKEVDSIVRQVQTVVCDHDLEIGVFMNGGGFCMMMGLPEVICNKCGANVTIGESDPKRLMKKKGIKISKKDLDQLIKWAQECFRNKEIKVWSASDITEDPIKALKNSVKWPHELPFKSIDMDKFNGASGS